MPGNDRKIDIGEDIAHQRKVWVIERIAWTLMGLVILGALFGFVGHGRFSARQAGSPEAGFVVQYERFERYHAQTQMSLRLDDAREGETTLRIGHDFLSKVEVLRIEPEPERVELDTGFSHYVFNTRGPGLIQLHYKPVTPGPLQIEIGLDGRPLQILPQLVYP